MSRPKYYFSTETLRFERYNPTIQRRIRNISLYLSVIVVISFGVRILIDHIYDSPKMSYFNSENSRLKTEYSALNSKIAKAEMLLSEVQKRDDKMYRSVFDLPPLPSSVREAGYGGSETPYAELASNGNNEMVNNTALELDKLSVKARVQNGYLNDLFLKAQTSQKLIASKPSIQPISPAESFRITSTYGFRWDPFTGRRKMHAGLDLAGEIGLNIYSTGDGIVISAEDSKNGYGREVVIDHGFGYVTRYAHLQQINVKKGQAIRRGECVGLLGSSGRSTGPHLHYEVVYNNQTMNPLLFYYENLDSSEYSSITCQALK
ncbi:MAG: M23 family metallopeptidase [Bacteroidales bacterium]|nr:M23 family metallopeptidase [Bacteroidales bacterium]MCB8999760.1 M23 family metallopeptidase [Bacteroidales bacterium]MCB9013429.1 M23 family metallopeptidase [Bacteroidales bacterium]